MNLKTKHLLSINDLEKDEISLILKEAVSFKEVAQRKVKKVPTLRGKTIVNLFYEPSTRTRTSFELAAKRLSADVVNIATSASSIKKGESLKDTAKTLEAMNIDAVIIRHSSSGAPWFLSRIIDAVVINAGDGAHEHPTQALLDLFTIQEKIGRIEGLNVLIVGDIGHSRVARSNILALTKMGAKVTLCAPPTLIPMNIEELGVKITYHLEEVISEADIIYLLRLQLERQKENYFPSIREYTALYGLDKEQLKRAKDDVLIMHPGPINRGVEISSEVADRVNSLILEQVANGLAVRMAILYLLLSGKG